MNLPSAIGNPALRNSLQNLLNLPSPGRSYFNLMIPNLITIFLIGVAVVFLFMLILGGIEWITSGGDKTNVENARKRVTNALIGISLAFSAWAILALMEHLFDINLMNMEIPIL